MTMAWKRQRGEAAQVDERPARVNGEVRDIGRPVSASLRQRLQDVSSADRGLALSRQIVEQHGGSLGVEFPPDGGVCVVLILPTQRGRVPTAGF